MNASNLSLQELLDGLTGQECTAVLNSVGSILLIDIGQLGRGPHQMEDSAPQGWRSLLINSPWRLEREAEVICDWNADNSVSGEMTRCIEGLVGRTVERCLAVPPAWDLRVSFSGDMHLVVFSDSDAGRPHSWTMLGTDGLEVVAGPGLDPPGWDALWSTPVPPTS